MVGVTTMKIRMLSAISGHRFDDSGRATGMYSYMPGAELTIPHRDVDEETAHRFLENGYAEIVTGDAPPAHRTAMLDTTPTPRTARSRAARRKSATKKTQ